MSDTSEIMNELRAVRGQLTSINTRLSTLEGSLTARPCQQHGAEWTGLRTDVALLKQGVQVRVAKIAGVSALTSGILTLIGGWLLQFEGGP